MDCEKKVGNWNDVKNRRLELIKHRHRKVILTPRGELSAGIIERDNDLADFDGPDELDTFDLDPEYGIDIRY